MIRVAVCILALLVLISSVARAHPIPRRNHDRAIVVRLASNSDTKELTVQVDYRLEVDEFTALYQDLLGLDQKVDLARLRAPGAFYDVYTETYAPILASNL